MLSSQLNVSRETEQKLRQYLDMVEQEAVRQSLLSHRQEDRWQRHIVDSLQLLGFCDAPASWIDIGSGAGLPGVVIAIASPATNVTLVEPRKLRAQFLNHVAERLGLPNISVSHDKVQLVRCSPPSILSARAVAPLDRLLAMALHLADNRTTWLLPKGQRVHDELEQAKRTWQGEFQLKPSITDPNASIVVARHIRRKEGR